MKRFLPLVLVGAALVAVSTSARAQVFIKPTGMKAVPVRVQTLSAQVEIIGAVAITNWTLTAPLETSIPGGYSEGAVCDFVCARPRDAKVTAFSVKGWNTELTGRVEERGFTTPRVAFRAAPNDPLLRSGLNTGNSFRATVYPLNSWGGITVRGTWVQPLASSRLGAGYLLPLLGLRGATTRLKELNVKITVRQVPTRGALPALSNNYKLPFKVQDGARVLSLGQKNYRVLRDLAVTLKPLKLAGGLPLLVAPDPSSNGGHFVLAFVAHRALSNMAISGTGIEKGTTFSPKSPRAGDVVLASGAYTGDFTAQLSANGLAKLPLVPVQNAIADPLWATQRINVLGASAAANRSQIIALSKKYSVVSPFTSWLVVGDEDRKIYRRALVSSQLDPLVREYWIRVGDGQDKGARVAQLKKAVTQISKANGLNVEDELYMRLGSATNYAAWREYESQGRAHAKAEKRLTRLLNIHQKYMEGLGFKGKSYGDPAQIYFETGIYDLRNKIREEYRKPHPNYAQLNEWEHRFAQIYGSEDIDPRLALWRTRIGAQAIEAQTTAAENAGDTAKLQKITYNRNVNSHGVYFTNNIGDPPIYVSAPADARQVVAVMPDGQVKTLDYNRFEKRWEGNYDVPVGTRDGDYTIPILIVNADGTRRRHAMPFRVDTKAPTGKGTVELSSQSSPSGERLIRLEVEHGGDVAVVTALLPWGEKVALLPSTVRGNSFFASARVPRDYIGKPIEVNYILVDRAHNTTSIKAESGTVASDANAR